MGQAARLLRVSPETVRRWTEPGRLPAHRAPDGSRAVDGTALAAFAKERAVGLHPLPAGAVATSGSLAAPGLRARPRIRRWRGRSRST